MLKIRQTNRRVIMLTSKIIIASGPVIVENNKVLLNISSGDTFWKFCGSKIRNNELL